MYVVVPGNFPLPASETWRRLGNCHGRPDEMFPEGPGGVTVAKRICAPCPVRVPCLEYALAHKIHHGVWGGCSERERRSIRRAHRLAARGELTVVPPAVGSE